MTVCQSPEVVRAGYLIKSPPDDAPPMSQWRRRWFVLCDSLRAYPLADRFVRLEYYQNENEARRLSDPKGIINLKTCTRVSIQKPLKGHKFVFDVCTIERVYHLAAETAYEKQQWISVLNDLLFTANGKHQVRLQVEGTDNGETTSLAEGMQESQLSQLRPAVMPVSGDSVLVLDRNQQKPDRPLSFAGLPTESFAREQPRLNSPVVAYRLDPGGPSDGPPVPERKNRPLPPTPATISTSQMKADSNVPQKRTSESSVIPTSHGHRQLTVAESASSNTSAVTPQNYQILYPTSKLPSGCAIPNYETAEIICDEEVNYELASPLEHVTAATYEATSYLPDEEEQEQMYDQAGHVERDTHEPLAYEVPTQSWPLKRKPHSPQMPKQKSAPLCTQQYSESNPPVPPPRRKKVAKRESLRQQKDFHGSLPNVGDYSEVEAKPLSADDDSEDYGHIVRIEPIKNHRLSQPEIIPITSSLPPQSPDSPVPKPRRYYENIGYARAPKSEANYSLVQYN